MPDTNDPRAPARTAEHRTVEADRSAQDLRGGASAPLLRLQGVRKSFGPLAVLDGLDLELHQGESLAVLGHSGTGKSVLLKVIIGLLRPDAGSVWLWGCRTDGLGEEELVPFRRRMGMVFQSGALFDSMTVAENVAFPLLESLQANRRKELSGDRIRRIVKERLEWVGLEDAGGKSPSELSGGMRKRAALARTLAVDPELILYDEPTTGLDPVTGRKISTLIHDMDKKLKATSIVVTHDLECARAVAGRWAFLAGGRLLADGTPEELLESPDEVLQEFLAPLRR